MAIELKQQLKLSQQLVMTPQLQQAIKLLQLSRLELLATVQQELQENPVLEECSRPRTKRPMTPSARKRGRCPAPAESSTDGESNGEASDAEKIADVDWQNYMDAYPQTGMAVAGDDDERRSLEATLTERDDAPATTSSGSSSSPSSATTSARRGLDHRQPRRRRLSAVRRRGDRAPGAACRGGVGRSALAEGPGTSTRRASRRATCASAC